MIYALQPQAGRAPDLLVEDKGMYLLAVISDS